jgi:acetolactate synthase-1/2/3 large subunit
LISEKTNGEAIIVTDVGQHQMIACRYSRFTKSKGSITSGGLGTMGFGLPAALGAKIGAPDREVIAVLGDGGFQMTIQELATIYQTKTKVKILLLNNEFLGMVRQWQQLFFEKRYSFTKMDNPDFQVVAEGFRIKTNRVIKREKLDVALDEFLTADSSFFLEIMVGKENNVFPMVPSGKCVSDIRLE